MSLIVLTERFGNSGVTDWPFVENLPRITAMILNGDSWTRITAMNMKRFSVLWTHISNNKHFVLVSTDIVSSHMLIPTDASCSDQHNSFVLNGSYWPHQTFSFQLSAFKRIFNFRSHQQSLRYERSTLNTQTHKVWENYVTKKKIRNSKIWNMERGNSITKHLSIHPRINGHPVLAGIVCASIKAISDW